MDVAAAFGDPSKVSTVWKWQSGANAGWAFYTPSLADGGAAYAASRGYSALTRIDAGEGFWVNARQGFPASFGAGGLLSTASFQDGSGPAHADILAPGWSLIAVGDSPSPRDFVNGIALAPVSGSAAASLTTLWAWDAGDAVNSPGWFFYAPGLDNSGALDAYIQAKGYLDFRARSRKLDASTGFWVNHP